MSWTCSACTFVNANASSSSCEICGSSRVVAAIKPPSVVPSSPWACRQCTYENVALASACAMCGMKAPSSTEMKAAAPAREEIKSAPMIIDDVKSAPALMSSIVPADAARLLREAQAREMERIEREKVIQSRLKADRQAETARKREAIAAERKEIDRRKLMERMQTAKARQDIELKVEEEQRRLKERRAEIENAAKDIPSAVRMLRDRYGMDGLRDVINVIAKIVANIIRLPEEEKFRTLQLSSVVYKNRIECRLGATSILTALGFEQRTVEDTSDESGKQEVLFMSKPDVPMLEVEYAKMQALLNYPDTNLRKLLDAAGPIADTSSQLALFFLMSLQRLFDNIVIAPSSSIARKIDTRSDLFSAFFKPFPPAIPILLEFEFALEDPSWTCKAATVTNLQKALRDLEREIRARIPSSPIVVALDYVYRHNSFAAASAVVDKFVSVLNNVVNDMHQTRHHVVPLAPLFKLSGPVDGARELISSLGFDVNPEMTVARIPYPYENGIESYKLALEVMQRAWKQLIKTVRRS